MYKFSEYTDRYPPYRPEVYSSSKRVGIPRIYTTAIDSTHSFNKSSNYRSISDCTRRPPTASDPVDMDFVSSSRTNFHVPRAYFYLGSIPNEIDKHRRKKLPTLTESTTIIPPLTSSSIEQFSVD